MMVFDSPSGENIRFFLSIAQHSDAMRILAVALMLTASASLSRAQGEGTKDSLAGPCTLRDCVHYAMHHLPLLQETRLQEEITGHIIGAKLADWFPQVTFTSYLQRNPQPPLSLLQGSPVPTLLPFSSSGQFTATQALFNRDVLLAASTAGDVREASRDQTARTAIDAVVAVSKAFYAVLLTREELRLLDDDIVRLTQSRQDAYNQYESGIVDKTDYQRASIALNNAEAQREQTQELLGARYASLRQQMGYPPDAPLTLARDTSEDSPDMLIDTSQSLHVPQRIEYQLLSVQKRLLEANVRYSRWSFLPSLSAYAAYNLNYQNDHLADLYRRDLPSSWIGLELTFPILQGGKRIQQLDQAELELESIDYSLRSLNDAVHAEYAQALATYKGSLTNYLALRENAALAQEVYDTIDLQYKAGTKTYLEVITAETDLRAAQVNETNALYQVLTAKLDVQRALGTIHYEY
jgi:outer membrane protein